MSEAADRETLESEQLRLRLRVGELNAALRQEQEKFLDMLDRLQEREEAAVQRALAELSRLRQRHELILDAAGEGVYGLDVEGKTTFVNPAAASMLGWDADALLGRMQHDMIHHTRSDGRPYAREECPIYASLRDGAVHHVEDEIFWRQDGTSFPVEYTSTPMFEGGRLVGAVVVFRDIGERVEHQRALEETAAELELAVDELRARKEDADQARAAAEAANRAKSDFLAVMSHELRTPLNAIIGYADLLLAGVPAPVAKESQKQIERMQSAGRHLLSLIDEILAFSRIEAGRAELRIEATDMNELIAEAAELIEPLAREKQLRFRVRADALPQRIETDAGKLRQILLNLLSNAVKFTDRGEVALELRIEKGTLVLQVRDTGIGIRSEHMEQIFDPFWQVDQGSTRATGGTGLGLSVTRSLARIMGGEVSVESVPGRGSTFTVRLPLEPGNEPVKAGGAASRPDRER